MTSADQITMFEPTGSELADLAMQHANRSHMLQAQADKLAARMFAFAARSYDHKAQEAMALAVVCETAYQLETLAGLA